MVDNGDNTYGGKYVVNPRYATMSYKRQHPRSQVPPSFPLLVWGEPGNEAKVTVHICHY